jgi:hypothetical protein
MPSAARTTATETVSAGRAQQSRTTVCKILPVSESATSAGHLSSLTIIAQHFLRRRSKTMGIQPGAT